MYYGTVPKYKVWHFNFISFIAICSHLSNDSDKNVVYLPNVGQSDEGTYL